MKRPKTPPDTESILEEVLKNKQNLGKIIANSSIVDSKGRYLHWDEMRFKETSQELTPEQMWTGIRLARRFASQTLPLRDGANRPFTYCEPPRLKALLRKLDMNAGGSLASDINSFSGGDGRLYLTRTLAEEPFASSLIEGAATTRKVAKKLIFEGRSPVTKDERMVLNNYKALEFIKTFRNDDLTIEVLLELHRIVTIDTLEDPDDAGRIRTNNDVHVVDRLSGEVLHQPPDYVDLPERLASLISFANQVPEPRSWLHPLSKAVLLHFMLAYEHPFVDGNGRVARAVFYWSALRDGYWLMEYVSISSVIAESKIQYGKAYLYTETDEGDTTYFLIYNMEILDKAMTRLDEYVNKRRVELTNFEKNISDSHVFNHRQSWLLNEFARNRTGSVTISEHQKRNNVSYLTARSDLESLATLLLLKKEKKARVSTYVPVRDLIKLLSLTSEQP